MFLFSFFWFQAVNPSIAIKPLQPDHKKHTDDDGSCSVASSKDMIFKPASASASVFYFLRGYIS
ncbi:hypothetical protein HanHA300_Chr01g0032931 [Helianthus annuus]|nr:hypothetical protein HanHA300_Chr01g0032931 [Helianthus annuus]KAJ0628335.1 hypothetical protein HanHA89_Chr01g0035491 [Helianthus annuus]KAJ0784620.1 hypothetical protein HanLR1_Chr01g0033981 [Helianthus annuus]